MKNKESGFFHKKSVVASFGVVALLAGAFFLNEGYISGRVTGNVVQSEVQILGLVPAIGMILIICSAILIIYAIVKKE